MGGYNEAYGMMNDNWLPDAAIPNRTAGLADVGDERRHVRRHLLNLRCWLNGVDMPAPHDTEAAPTSSLWSI
jgi:hypothetical protein